MGRKVADDILQSDAAQFSAGLSLQMANMDWLYSSTVDVDVIGYGESSEVYVTTRWKPEWPNPDMCWTEKNESESLNGLQKFCFRFTYTYH